MIDYKYKEVLFVYSMKRGDVYMKKILIASFMIIITLFSLVGCKGRALERKTEVAPSSKSSTAISSAKENANNSKTAAKASNSTIQTLSDTIDKLDQTLNSLDDTDDLNSIESIINNN